jgi:hypothetical protein
MRYVQFRNAIKKELLESRAGLTWAELKERLDLPYKQPCPEWVKRMEEEDGLSRARGTGHAYVWRIRPASTAPRQEGAVRPEAQGG